MFGLTKQSYYQRIKRANKRVEREQYILNEVQEIRKELPRSGGRKLLIYLEDFFAQTGVTIGRNSLFDLLRRNGMLIKKSKRA